MATPLSRMISSGASLFTVASAPASVDLEPAAPAAPAAARRPSAVRGASSATARDAAGILSSPIGIAAIVAGVGAVGFVAWKLLRKKGRRR